ncbi:MAG: hypothetical protein NTU50_07850 [Actinobacteria bacterium]|nr:hypothetical protein [Actinomycetota bacterium]
MNSKMLLPMLNKTGEYACIEVSLNETDTVAAMKVRFNLPRRSLYVASGGTVELLPRAEGDVGLPLSEFVVSLN